MVSLKNWSEQSECHSVLSSNVFEMMEKVNVWRDLIGRNDGLLDQELQSISGHLDEINEALDRADTYLNEGEEKEEEEDDEEEDDEEDPIGDSMRDYREGMFL